MQIKISINNSKLGAQIPSINLPPLQSCRKDAPCHKGCYAQKGRFLFKNVKESLMNNFACYVNDNEKYFNDVISFLNDKLVTYKYFRWHSAGDIVDDNYLLGMIRVAKKCKNVKFLCFTKKFGIVNKYLGRGEKLPNNLKIVFSAWDKDFKVNNPYGLPVAYVCFKKKDKNPIIPELSIPCEGQCYKCQSCWSLHNGQSVVFNQH